MSDEFWGMVVLALAVLAAALVVNRGLGAIARGLEMRNAALARMRMHGGRVPALGEKARP